MSKSDRLVKKEEMLAIRAGIKKKYAEEYFGKDNPRDKKNRGKFSDIEFNTSRASYKPLVDSFHIEIEEKIKNFYRLGGEEFGIPSTETFMKIFRKDDYVPSRKILYSCLLYIDDIQKVTYDLAASAINIAIPPSGLIIDSPHHKDIVPRQLLAEGRVSHATIVWLVVHPVGGVRYWVQPIGKVESDGKWKAPIYIGSVDPGDVGIRSQIRAFVNPSALLKEGLELYSWPEAQLASEIVEVVRGSV